MITDQMIIIGGGPAGLSAAVYAARAGFQPLVLAGSPPGGQLMLTTEVENFPGYKTILGPELVDQLRNQARLFGAQIKDENVLSLQVESSPFVVSTSTSTHRAKSIVVATGAKALWLGLESEKKLRGRGLSACATCDGFFFRNKIVAVVGGGDTAMEEAQTLSKFANKVYLIHRRDHLRASRIMQDRVKHNPKIQLILSNEITNIEGDLKVEGVTLKNIFEESTHLKLDGVFVAIGHKPDTELFTPILAHDEDGYIYTAQSYALARMQDSKNQNSNYSFDYEYPSSSSRNGIFIAGDCVDKIYRQAATAVGMGVAAALDAQRWLTST